MSEETNPKGFLSLSCDGDEYLVSLDFDCPVTSVDDSSSSSINSPFSPSFKMFASLSILPSFTADDDRSVVWQLLPTMTLAPSSSRIKNAMI